MRRPDSALDQMRNASTHQTSSRPPSATATTAPGASPTAQRGQPSYQQQQQHSPTAHFRSPHDQLGYGHQQQQDFFSLPPQRPSYVDPSLPHSPHGPYSPPDRRPQSSASSSSLWGPPHQPPPPPHSASSHAAKYPSLRGDHILDTSPPDPELQKRTSTLIGLAGSGPGSAPQQMPPPHSSHPHSQQYFMATSPQSEEPQRILYRGADIGAMPQFPAGPPGGQTYGGSGFPHYLSSIAPPPLSTRTSLLASPTKSHEGKGDPKRTPPSPTRQPALKRSKTGSTDDPAQWYQAADASPDSGSDAKRAMSSMTSTVKTRPVVLLSADQKKANHIHSEQKRRATIRKGYEALCEVVPSLREVVAAGGPGVGAVTTAVPGMSPVESEKKPKKPSRSKSGKQKEGSDDGGLGGVVKSEALVLTKTIEHVEALIAERNKLLGEHAQLAHALPPHERPADYVPGQTTSLQPGARELRNWETPWHGGSGLPPPHMRDAMVWMKGLGGDDSDDDDDGDDDD